MTPLIDALLIGRQARAALFTACTILLSALSACMAPQHAPVKSAAASAQAPEVGVSVSLAMEKPVEALRSYEQSLAARPQSASTRILHARLLMISGKLADAREEFNVVIADDPGNADALYNLSLVDGLDGRGDEQESLLHQVVQMDGGHAEALAALGDLALCRGETAAAGGYYARALSDDPANAQALLGQGAVLERTAEWAEAQGMYSRAVAARPDYPIAYIARARVREELADEEGAQQDLERAITLDPQYPSAYIDRGKLYARHSRNEEAVADFSMAIRLDPTQLTAYALRADAYAACGDSAGALADWEYVVALKPEYGDAYAPLASLAWTAGDWQKAHDAFLAAYQYDEDPSLVLCAALCSLRLKNRDDIDQTLEPVLGHAPADSWSHTVARFLENPGSEASLLSRIDHERDQGLRARMLFYVAVSSLANGMERAGATYLEQVEGKGSPRMIEARLARTELARQVASEGN